MTYVSKFRGTGGMVVAAFTCPHHDTFDVEVPREANGDAPDQIACTEAISDRTPCGAAATWTPSVVVGRVRRVEVVRGRWEKPERKTYLDTRKLGEGQDPEEFWDERKKIWDEERRKRVKELLR